MGMLQLAGMVSGFGKGLQRGLENTQSYMTNSMLLQERENLERERMKLTFAHDEGMLQKRGEQERALMTERATLEDKFATARDERTHSQALDRLEADQDERARQARITRDFERKQDQTKADRELEKEERGRQDKLGEEERKTKAQIEEEKRKEQAAIRTEGRQEKRDQKKRQEEGGFRLVEQMLQNQRPTGTSGGSDKLDANTNARLKLFSDRIKGLEDELQNVMTTPERQMAIRREIAKLQDQQNALVGIQSSAASRPPIRFPQ